jgi:hypothetical protein
MPDHEGQGDLERAHDDEPDPEQDREDGHGRDRRRGDHDPGDHADDAEHGPPQAGSANAGERAEKRGYALHDPGDADQQADRGDGQVQVTDQQDAYHDEKQPADALPGAAPLSAVERTDQVKDPRYDRQDAEQDGDHVE